MEYVKHNYSGRVYQVLRDHGPGSTPHLRCSEGWERYLKETSIQQFFTPYKGPEGEPSQISVLAEIQWEKAQMGEGPKVSSQEPSKSLGKPKSTKASSGGEYTLRDLCSELNTTPSIARKILRSQGKTAPDGGWRWPNAEAAKSIKRLIKKFL